MSERPSERPWEDQLLQTSLKLRELVLGRGERGEKGKVPVREADRKFPGGACGVIGEVVGVHTTSIPQLAPALYEWMSGSRYCRMRGSHAIV